MSCSYAEAYKKIKENRIAKKKAKEAMAAEAANPTDSQGADDDFVCQEGDLVTLGWEAKLISTGVGIDRTSPIFGATNRPGKPEVPVEVQVGDGPGFEPKRGLKLAFSLVCKGTRAGDRVTIYSKPKGSGWLKSYDVYSESGKFLTVLSSEEKACKWSEEQVAFELEVVRVRPPAGRENKRRGMA